MYFTVEGQKFDTQHKSSSTTLAAPSLAKQKHSVCISEREFGGIKVSEIGAVYFYSQGGRLKTSSSKKNHTKRWE